MKLLCVRQPHQWDVPHDARSLQFKFGQSGKGDEGSVFGLGFVSAGMSDSEGRFGGKERGSTRKGTLGKIMSFPHCV